MNPYPAYRPSGVEWLGDMPEHWEVHLAKTLGRIRYGLGQPPRESAEGMPLIRATNVERGRIVEKDLIRVDPSDLPVGRDALLRAREIIVVRSGAYTADSAIIPARYEGAVTGYDMVMTITGALPEFIAFALLASYLRDDQLIVASTRSAQPHLNAEELGASLVLVPPLPEQAAIVEYLERETERIDALVAKMRLLIARLQEYRTALITRSVTRGVPSEGARAAGLDPSPRLKPSGVEWLGDVPEHWEVGNIRRYAEMKSGHTPSRQYPEYWEDCDIPWFTLSDVWQLRDGRATYLDETRELISRVGIANSAAELLPAGSVILSRTASIGFSGIMPVPMATSQDFWNWICGPKLTPRYLLLTFRSMQGEFNRLMMGSTHRTIYEASAASFCIPVPPTPEQQAIVEFLEERLQSNDAALDAATRAIERLQEYRTALITAAVTGKVDVREPVAPDGSLMARGTMLDLDRGHIAAGIAIHSR